MPHIRAALAESLGPAYRVEREVRPLGECRLFVAQEAPDGPELLVKVLPGPLSLAVDADTFHRELVSLADRLNHPRLVPPRGAGRAAAFVYHTRAFVKGTTLRATLQRDGPLPLAHAVDILRDVLAALAHCHQAGLVHGDVRPENVPLAERHARLADAGVLGALARASRGGAPGAASTALRAVSYLAPEHRDGGDAADPRADVFAAGVLLHEMLTGRPLQAEAEPLDETRSVPAWLLDLLRRCLAPEPAARWAHAGEALAALPARA